MAVLLSVPICAQSTDEVWIKLDGCAYTAKNEIEAILVVGSHVMQFRVPYDEKAGYWVGRAPETFHPRQPSTSLIIDGHLRTGWKKSKWVRLPDRDVAQFTFDCSEQHSAWQFHVRLADEIPIDSERLLQSPPPWKKTSRPKTTSELDFAGVQAEGESLCLLLAWPKEQADCLAYGLKIVTKHGEGEPLFSPGSDHSRLPTFNPKLQSQKRGNGGVPLSYENVAQALRKQHNRQTDNSLEDHLKTLKTAGLKMLTIEVK
jgi:hypothetical protein